MKTLLITLACLAFVATSVPIVKRFEAGETFCFSDDVRTFLFIQPSTLSLN